MISLALLPRLSRSGRPPKVAMAARRLGAAVAAGSTAVACAYLGMPSERRGPPYKSLTPGQLLHSTLLAKSRVESDCVRLQFELPSPEHTLGLPVPGHVMVIDAANNYRPYSPITIDSTTAGSFELLVKEYPHGEFSSKLSRMEPGDQASFVGPVASRYEYRNGSTRHLGLVAAGTGITPMWQIIQAVLTNPEDCTRVSLVYASSSAEGILLKDELDRAAASHPERLSITYLASQPATRGTRLPADVQRGRVCADVLAARLPPPPRADEPDSEETRAACQLLVCGPEAMLRELCGPRARDGGVTPQGAGGAQAELPAIGGLLGSLGYRANQVTWL